LKLFIAGLIFGVAIEPLIKELAALLRTFSETIKSSLGVKISQNNLKMNSTFGGEGTHVIGFAAPEDEEEEGEEI